MYISSVWWYIILKVSSRNIYWTGCINRWIIYCRTFRCTVAFKNSTAYGCTSVRPYCTAISICSIITKLASKNRYYSTAVIIYSGTVCCRCIRAYICRFINIYKSVTPNSSTVSRRRIITYRSTKIYSGISSCTCIYCAPCAAEVLILFLIVTENSIIFSTNFLIFFMHTS